ncbi:MAG: NTP transferase domain-containing protein [Caldilineaceae bacterium]
MKLWLIAPVKPFAEGKSRLATVLSWQQRRTLNRHLFHNLLAQAKAAQVLTGVIVVGRDPQIMAGVAWKQVLFEQEEKATLNDALEQGRRRALTCNADAILILPADLPLLNKGDITQLHQLGKAQTGMVIAPSHDGGTNALLLHPPKRFPLPLANKALPITAPWRKRPVCPITFSTHPLCPSIWIGPKTWRNCQPLMVMANRWHPVTSISNRFPLTIKYHFSF